MYFVGYSWYDHLKSLLYPDEDSSDKSVLAVLWELIKLCFSKRNASAFQNSLFTIVVIVIIIRLLNTQKWFNETFTSIAAIFTGTQKVQVVQDNAKSNATNEDTITENSSVVSSSHSKLSSKKRKKTALDVNIPRSKEHISNSVDLSMHSEEVDNTQKKDKILTVDDLLLFSESEKCDDVDQDSSKISIQQCLTPIAKENYESKKQDEHIKSTEELLILFNDCDKTFNDPMLISTSTPNTSTSLWTQNQLAKNEAEENLISPIKDILTPKKNTPYQTKNNTPSYLYTSKQDAQMQLTPTKPNDMQPTGMHYDKLPYSATTMQPNVNWVHDPMHISYTNNIHENITAQVKQNSSMQTPENIAPHGLSPYKSAKIQLQTSPIAFDTSCQLQSSVKEQMSGSAHNSLECRDMHANPVTVSYSGVSENLQSLAPISAEHIYVNTNTPCKPIFQNQIPSNPYSMAEFITTQSNIENQCSIIYTSAGHATKMRRTSVVCQEIHTDDLSTSTSARDCMTENPTIEMDRKNIHQQLTATQAIISDNMSAQTNTGNLFNTPVELKDIKSSVNSVHGCMTLDPTVGMDHRNIYQQPTQAIISDNLPAQDVNSSITNIRAGMAVNPTVGLDRNNAYQHPTYTQSITSDNLQARTNTENLFNTPVEMKNVNSFTSVRGYMAANPTVSMDHSTIYQHPTYTPSITSVNLPAQTNTGYLFNTPVEMKNGNSSATSVHNIMNVNPTVVMDHKNVYQHQAAGQAMLSNTLSTQRNLQNQGSLYNTPSGGMKDINSSTNSVRNIMAVNPTVVMDHKNIYQHQAGGQAILSDTLSPQRQLQNQGTLYNTLSGGTRDMNSSTSSVPNIMAVNPTVIMDHKNIYQHQAAGQAIFSHNLSPQSNLQNQGIMYNTPSGGMKDFNSTTTNVRNIMAVNPTVVMDHKNLYQHQASGQAIPFDILPLQANTESQGSSLFTPSVEIENKSSSTSVHNFMAANPTIDMNRTTLYKPQTLAQANIERQSTMLYPTSEQMLFTNAPINSIPNYMTDYTNNMGTTNILHHQTGAQAGPSDTLASQVNKDNDDLMG